MTTTHRNYKTVQQTWRGLFEIKKKDLCSLTQSININFFSYFLLDSPLYQKEGCFSAKTAKTGVYLGTYSSNSYSMVEQCAQAAKGQDFTEFALFEGGLCKGGHDLQEEYNDQGASLGLCKSHVGGKDFVVLYSLKQTGR